MTVRPGTSLFPSSVYDGDDSGCAVFAPSLLPLTHSFTSFMCLLPDNPGASARFASRNRVPLGKRDHEEYRLFSSDGYLPGGELGAELGLSTFKVVGIK